MEPLEPRRSTKMNQGIFPSYRGVVSERDDIKGKMISDQKRPIGNPASSLGHKAFVERMRRLSEVERRVTSDFDRAVDRTAERLSLEMREKKRPCSK